MAVTNGYTYYEIYSQYLENPSLQGTFYRAESGELKEGAEAIYCTQISRNVIEDFQLEVSKGRLFSETDYVLGEKIPVLMGHGYAEIYEIGDVFECNYLFDTYSFEVVGFLKEGSKISPNGENFGLDNQVVIPAFAIDETKEITPGLKIHYANKTSGTVILPRENAERFYGIIVPLLENAELGEYTWTVRPTELFFKELFGISMQTGKRLLAVCCILLCMAELWGIICFSKYAWASTKCTAIRGILYGILLFTFACFFYVLINCVYVFLLKIMVMQIVHFAVIGLISVASVLAGRMFWKNDIGASRHANDLVK